MSRPSYASMACLVFIVARAEAVHAGQVQVWFYNGGTLAGVARDSGSAQPGLHVALGALAAGPTTVEQQAGLISAIPAGVSIEQISTDGDSLGVEFSSALVAAGLDDLRIENIYRQVLWTVRPYNDGTDLRLTVGGKLLATYLPPVIKPKPAQSPAPTGITTGVLTGRSVTLSPGHGMYWTGSYWTTQRPVYCSPLNQEDYHNLELMQYLEKHLVAEGMTTRLVRCTNKSYGNHSTGNEWWKMAAYLWLQNIGYPCSVYGSSSGCTTGSGGSESSDDIRSRPLASDYDGSDIYVSLHTNGSSGYCVGGGCPTGSETYYDASSEHAAWGAVSQTLANNINGSLMSAITSAYDSGWICHGTCVKNSNGAYGEIRVPDRAATLTELAFHDTCDRDGLYLRDNFFRSVAMWGMYKGICNYFGASPTWAMYSDEHVSDTIPTSMNPGQAYPVTVTFRNRGVLWSSARAFRLGAVGDSDPLTTATRVDVSGEIGPGDTCTFSFTLTAPLAPGTYTTDWRMVRDGYTWFGATVTRQVQVTSPAVTILSDTFETYADQAAFETVWHDTAASEYYLDTAFGNPGKSVALPSPSGNDLGVYYANLGQTVNGTDSSPLVFQYDLYLDPVGSPNWSGGRHYCEIRGYAGGSYENGGLSSLIAVGLYNSSTNTFNTQRYQGRVLSGSNWVTLDDAAAPARAGGWHEVRVDIRTSTIRFYIDGTLSRTEPRPNSNGFDSVVIGSDLTANGHACHADNVKVLLYVSPPDITGQPSNQNVCPGASVSFSVTASGFGPISYQWQKNQANLSEGGRISGSQTATLQIAGAIAADAGNYRCVVSNSAGGTPSAEASLVVAAPTVITLQPTPRNPAYGSTVVFTIVAAGSGTLNYQWQKNGQNLVNGGNVSGATSTTLSLAAVTLADEGMYRCIVTGYCDMATSNEVSLTLRPPAGDIDGDRDVDQTDFAQLQICLNEPATFISDPACVPADLDADEDVDQYDAGVLQDCLSGPQVPASYTCGGG